MSRAKVEGVVVVDEFGGEVCCVASWTLTCTAVEVAQLWTVDWLPSVAATRRQLPTSLASSCPAQGLHWVRPQDPRRPRTGRVLRWHRNVCGLHILICLCAKFCVFNEFVSCLCTSVYSICTCSVSLWRCALLLLMFVCACQFTKVCPPQSVTPSPSSSEREVSGPCGI